jgi:hypothetical protein
MSDVDGTTQDLLSTLADLRGRIALLEGSAETTQRSSNGADFAGAAPTPIEPNFGRRSLLRKIGLAGAGVAAVSLMGSERAAAANGDPVILGQNVGGGANTPQTLLKVTSLAASANAIFAVTDGPEPPANGRKAAIVGVASGNGSVDTGIAGSSTAGGGIGVLGTGATALGATSSTVHLKLAGPGFLGAGLPTTAQVLAGQNLLGTIVLDSTANLWLGVGGSHRKLAGPDTAGALHVIDPLRVYDSRGVGILAAGTSRVVPVSGVVVASRSVPAGAKAILATLTLTGTQNTGFMTITAGNVGSTASSSINWFGSGQDLATTVVSKLDSAGQAKMFNNSGNASHFILDITGYYL